MFSGLASDSMELEIQPQEQIGDIHKDEPLNTDTDGQTMPQHLPTEVQLVADDPGIFISPEFYDDPFSCSSPVSHPQPLPAASQAEAMARFRPTPRDIISGIAPHLFDERRRRPQQPRRASIPSWYLYDRRPKSSPLRKSVVVQWDENGKITKVKGVNMGSSVDIYFAERNRKRSSSARPSFISSNLDSDNEDDDHLTLNQGPSRRRFGSSSAGSSIIDINLGVAFKSPLGRRSSSVKSSSGSGWGARKGRSNSVYGMPDRSASRSASVAPSTAPATPASASPAPSVKGAKTKSGFRGWHMKSKSDLGRSSASSISSSGSGSSSNSSSPSSSTEDVSVGLGLKPVLTTFGTLEDEEEGVGVDKFRWRKLKLDGRVFKNFMGKMKPTSSQMATAKVQ